MNNFLSTMKFFIFVSNKIRLWQKELLVLDADLDEKLRTTQAKMIRKTNSSVSFSAVINEIVRNHLKK